MGINSCCCTPHGTDLWTGHTGPVPPSSPVTSPVTSPSHQCSHQSSHQPLQSLSLHLAERKLSPPLPVLSGSCSGQEWPFRKFDQAQTSCMQPHLLQLSQALPLDRHPPLLPVATHSLCLPGPYCPSPTPSCVMVPNWPVPPSLAVQPSTPCCCQGSLQRQTRTLIVILV